MTKLLKKMNPTPPIEETRVALMPRIREGIFILCIAVSAFLWIALFSYQHTDAIWVVTQYDTPITNAGGRAGAWVGTILLYTFGALAYIFPLFLVYSGWIGFRDRYKERDKINYQTLSLHTLGLFSALFTGCGLISLLFPSLPISLNVSPGGLLGDWLGNGLSLFLNDAGAILLLLALFLTGITLLTGLSWLKLLQLIGQGIVNQIKKRKNTPQPVPIIIPAPVVVSKPVVHKLETKKAAKPPVKIEYKAPPVAIRVDDDSPVEGTLPSLSLLDLPEEKTIGIGYSDADLEAMSRDVEARLHDFGIEVQVVAVHPGPVITRFEMQPAAGIKVSRITGLVKDLARSLSVTSVRIVEVIPGKSVVGLELPNESREIVRLREILSSPQYEQAQSPLSMALGKDIAGHSVVVDLGKMPHLLVAGTTGSGKSVGLNAMLLSLLYKSTPEEVRMIMIDPKMLELSIYDGIPHLLAPVVTDMKEAANALRWCVGEMDRRYRLMARLGVRNLAGYNTKIREAIKKGNPILDPLWQPQMSEQAEPLTELPYIVVLVDEFADMIMVVGKKVEELIARIAQKARAAGIHLILATQRPSVDVITGLIKANVPTRIAFQVSSKIDSRTILDQQGAEQLLGHGDMLYLPPGTGVPIRVHGAFVADQEVHRVVSDWKRRGQPEYISSILENSNEGSESGESTAEGGSESDPLYDQAVQIVIESRRASISSIQRRLKIGYNRAARLIEDMERAGLVSPMESNGSREVLVPASIE